MLAHRVACGAVLTASHRRAQARALDEVVQAGLVAMQLGGPTLIAGAEARLAAGQVGTTRTGTAAALATAGTLQPMGMPIQSPCPCRACAWALHGGRGLRGRAAHAEELRVAIRFLGTVSIPMATHSMPLSSRASVQSMPLSSCVSVQSMPLSNLSDADCYNFVNI